MTAKQAAIPKRKEKIALIHVAKKECGLSDEHYRALLYGAAGVDSAADIRTEGEFQQVMEAFEKLGFKRRGSLERLDADAWGCNPAQKNYIERLWRQVSRKKSRESLHAFIRRTTGVDHPRFMDSRAASLVIVALERMARKQGIEGRRS